MQFLRGILCASALALSFNISVVPAQQSTDSASPPQSSSPSSPPSVCTPAAAPACLLTTGTISDAAFRCNESVFTGIAEIFAEFGQIESGQRGNISIFALLFLVDSIKKCDKLSSEGGFGLGQLCPYLDSLRMIAFSACQKLPLGSSEGQNCARAALLLLEATGPMCGGINPNESADPAHQNDCEAYLAKSQQCHANCQNPACLCRPSSTAGYTAAESLEYCLKVCDDADARGLSVAVNDWQCPPALLPTKFRGSAVVLGRKHPQPVSFGAPGYKPVTLDKSVKAAAPLLLNDPDASEPRKKLEEKIREFIQTNSSTTRAAPKKGRNSTKTKVRQTDLDSGAPGVAGDKTSKAKRVGGDTDFGSPGVARDDRGPMRQKRSDGGGSKSSSKSDTSFGSAGVPRDGGGGGGSQRAPSGGFSAGSSMGPSGGLSATTRPK